MEEIEKFIIEKIEELTFTTVTADDKLWSDKILDSITIVELAVALELNYGIKIGNSEITVENFDSVSELFKFVKNKRN
jgi:acyl carrier protein